MIRILWNFVPTRVKVIIPHKLKSFFVINELNELETLIKKKSQNIDSLKSSLWKNPYLARNFIIKLKQDKKSFIMNKSMKNILTKNFNEKGYILDLGCGPGSQLKELTSSNRIIGLDSSLILLREAVKQNKNLLPERLFICGDTFNLPLKNNSINGAYSRMFIYHFQKWESILKELARICRKGSTLNIHFVNYEYYESQSSILFDFMNPKDNSLYYSAPSISEISQVATNLGLMITSRYPVQFFNNPLILVDSNFKNFDQKLKNSSYLNLIIWFELNITKLLPINSSPWQVIEFEKISDS